MNMSILNIILIAFFIFFIYVGYRRGLIASVIHWVGLFVSMILVVRFAPMVKAGLMAKFPIGNFFATSLAYILIFVLITILANLLIILMNQVADKLSLNFLNRSLGAAFGFLNSILILILFLILIDMLPFTKPIGKWVNTSPIIQETQKLKNSLKPVIQQQIKNQIKK